MSGSAGFSAKTPVIAPNGYVTCRAAARLAGSQLYAPATSAARSIVAR